MAGQKKSMLAWIAAACVTGIIVFFGIIYGLGHLSGKDDANTSDEAITVKSSPENKVEAANQNNNAQENNSLIDEKAPQLTETASENNPEQNISEQVANQSDSTRTEDDENNQNQSEAKTELKIPTFDIVRVEPNGDTTLAGRAEPNASVSLLQDNEPVASSTANASGDFVITTDIPLKTGETSLSLRVETEDGATQESQDRIALAIPESGQGEFFVGLLRPGQPVEIISQTILGKPESVLTSADESKNLNKSEPASSESEVKAQKQNAEILRAASPGTGNLAIEAVEIDGNQFFVAGASDAGASLRLYLNDEIKGDIIAGPTGRWLFAGEKIPDFGNHTVRLDQIESETGDVIARVQVPFKHENPEDLIAAAEPVLTAKKQEDSADLEKNEQDQAASTQGDEATITAQQATAGNGLEKEIIAGGEGRLNLLTNKRPSVIIRRGDNLWTIAQRVYGQGPRYSVIYSANEDQIRNPDLIYPGQVFSLPDSQKDWGEVPGPEALEPERLVR